MEELITKSGFKLWIESGPLGHDYNRLREVKNYIIMPEIDIYRLDTYSRHTRKWCVAKYCI